MTGFGKAIGSHEGKKVSVEIRSLNSKSLDLNVRLPQVYRELENEIRKIIGTQLDRGKIDVSISMDSTGESKNFSINKELALAYYKDLKEIHTSIGDPDTDFLSLLVRMPEIFVNERAELNEDETKWLLSLVSNACSALTDHRKKEGEALCLDFETQLQGIRNLLAEIPKYEQVRIDLLKERIRKNLEDMKNVNVDANRFEQELIFYIEKLDVSEEKMRLSTHLDYFLETMQTPLSGKKLGFIAQEIGREINTLGSKSNHAEMQRTVVEMKDLLEKIKEQVLNTL